MPYDSDPPSSPDPLAFSTPHPPSSFATERLRALSTRRSATPTRSPTKFSHTSEIDTMSPWRIRVHVEAERDDGGEEEQAPGRGRMGGVVTVKVPVKGLESSPAPAGPVVRKATPRRRSVGKKAEEEEGEKKTKAKARSRSRAKKAGGAAEEEVGDTIVVKTVGDESSVDPTPMAKVTRRKSTTRKPRLTKKVEQNGDEGDAIVVEKTPAKKRTLAKRATPAKPATARGRKKSVTSSANLDNEPSRRQSVEVVIPVTHRGSGMDKALPVPMAPASQDYDDDYDDDFWEEVEKSTRPQTDMTYSEDPNSYTPRKQVNHGRGPKTPKMVDTPAKVGAASFYGKPGKTPLVILNADEESEHDEELPQAPPVEDDGEEFEHGLDDVDKFDPDFKYLSAGTSYTPKTRKKGALDPSSPASDREMDGVGVDTFYGDEYFDEDSDMEIAEAGIAHPDVEELPPGTPFRMKGALDGTPSSSAHNSSPIGAETSLFFRNRSASKGRTAETSRHSIPTPEASSSPTGSTSSFTQSRRDALTQRSPTGMSRYITPEVSGLPSCPPRLPTARRRSEVDLTPSLDRIVEASSTLGGVIDTFEERAAVRDSIVRGVLDRSDSMSSNEDPRRKRLLTPPESVEDNDSKSKDVLTSLGGGTIGTGFNPVFEPSSLASVSRDPYTPPRASPQQANTSTRSASRLNSPPAPRADPEISNLITDRTHLLETQWALERAAVSRQAAEVGAITIADDSDSDSNSNSYNISTPATSSPQQPPGDRTQLLEEQWAADRNAGILRAQEIGAITIHDTTSASVLIFPSSSPSRPADSTTSFNASLARHLSSSPSQHTSTSSVSFLPQHLLWKPSHYAHLQAVLNSSKTPERGEMEYAVQIDRAHPSLRWVDMSELGVDREGWMRIKGREAAGVERFWEREKRMGMEWERREVVRRAAGLRIAGVVKRGRGGKGIGRV